MQQPYEAAAHSDALRLRWISVQCYEMALPGGKVLVTDPFYLDAEAWKKRGIPPQFARDIEPYLQSGFSVDDFTGGDYLLLNHIHGDHVNLVGQLWHKFYGRVLVPGDCAREVARIFDIPYAAIYPLYPGNTYHFEDFTLKVYPGAHDNRAFRDGKELTPSAVARLESMITLPTDLFEVPFPNDTTALGSIHNLNYLITTRDNYKIDFSAGRDFEGHLKAAADEHPNLMLRHRIRSYSPEQYARQLLDMGAQLMLPLHHNNAAASGEDLNAYFAQVNAILAKHGSAARAFNPEPYKWHTVRTSIISE